MAEDYIESITVGGVERLAQDTHWTGDANSFARDLAGNITSQGYDLTTAWWSTDQVFLGSTVYFRFGPVRFSPDGRKLYTEEDPPSPNRLVQFNLSRPWDMTAIPSTPVASAEVNPFRWFDWSNNGEKLYLQGGFSTMTEYTAETPFELGSISTTSAVGFDLESNTYSFQFVKGGKELVTFCTRFQGGDNFLFLEKYLLSDAYNIATAALSQRSKEWNPSTWQSVEGQFLSFQFAENGNVGYFLPDLGSGASSYSFHKLEFNEAYDITSIPTSSPLNSSTGDIEIFLGLGIDSTATSDFSFEAFQFMPNGCAVIIYDGSNTTESLYRIDLACGGFIPPSSDEAAGDTVASANSSPSAPYINRDPASLTNLEGNCVIIESTAVGACSSEEIIVVKQGGVDYTISSKFLGNDSFCGGLEAHLLDSYAVQNSSDPTNLISGADHLAGEVIAAWGDGQDLGFYKVSSTGTFTIPVAATSVTFGLPYDAWFKSVKLAHGDEAGTALAQRKKVNHLGFVLYCAHARGLEYGPSTDKLNPMPRIEAGKLISPDAIWPHYDEETIEFPGEWDTDSRVVLKARAPRGVTVLAAIIQMDTREKI